MRSISTYSLLIALALVAHPKSSSSSHQKGKTVGGRAAEKIAGGGPAKPHAYPFMARIVIGGQHVCGATIVKRNYVLTAAHCVVGKTKNDVTVVVGDHKISGKEEFEQEIKVKQIYIHFKYMKDTNKNNFAVIWLKSDVQFTNTITQANLPECHEPVTATEGWVAGWGSVKTAQRRRRKRAASDELNVAKVKVLSPEECKQKVPGVGKHELCAVKVDGGPCMGDEGGPLFIASKVVNHTFQQIGMLSQIKGDCETGTAVFMKVSEHVGWLHRRTLGCGNYPFYPST